MKGLVRRLRNKKAQSLVEYGLIIALIAIVCIVALRLLGNSARNQLNDVAGEIGSTTAGS
ncbi:MAG: Flp family type IVb pilin [Candidatus Omnitrophica bacterium]|nr:Flp family type IVb pilin [Candidatus Omnitrophota bacterium]